MNKCWLFLLFPFFIEAYTSRNPAVDVFTIGPMVHWNFGNGKMAISIGVELASMHYPGYYYEITDPMGAKQGNGLFPETESHGYGFDVGFEIEVGRYRRLRLYIEPQFNYNLFAGVGVGPVVEIPYNDENVHFGFQATPWALGLIDARVRYINASLFLCPGLFVKKFIY